MYYMVSVSHYLAAYIPTLIRILKNRKNGLFQIMSNFKITDLGLDLPLDYVLTFDVYMHF